MISDMLLLFFVFFLKRWLQARPCIWESGVVGKKSMALVYENSSRYSWIIYAVLELSHWPHFKIRFCCESNLLRSRLITCQSHGWIPGVVFFLYVRIFCRWREWMGNSPPEPVPFRKWVVTVVLHWNHSWKAALNTVLLSLSMLQIHQPSQPVCFLV